VATPKQPRGRRGNRDTSALREELTELVSDAVAQKIDAAAEKVTQKLDAAAARQEQKLAGQREKLDRERQRLEHREEHHLRGLERLAAHLDALEVWTRSAGAGRRPRFTRDEIAAAAVRLADAEGFDALSMRRLASEVGAGTMTLYHYVRTKDELLTLVSDAVMGELLIPDDEPIPDDWRAALVLIAERTRQCLQRHPWIFDVVDDPAIGPNAVRHFDQSMQAVASLDLTLAERLDVVGLIDEYVFGYCFHERNNLRPEHPAGEDYTGGVVRYMEELLRSGDYPELSKLAEEVGLGEALQVAEAHSRDPERFRRNLDRLLDGIEHDLPGRRR